MGISLRGTDLGSKSATTLHYKILREAQQNPSVTRPIKVQVYPNSRRFENATKSNMEMFMIQKASAELSLLESLFAKIKFVQEIGVHPIFHFTFASIYCHSQYSTISFEMFQSSKPPIAQNRIPIVKELHESLGFGPAFNRSVADLKDSTHHFRKEYLTSDGTAGRDLTDWKTLKTQNELSRMTRTFLEDEHYGLKYWPSRGSASPRRIPEYPKDSEKYAHVPVDL